jgi:hypothetical protein
LLARGLTLKRTIPAHEPPPEKAAGADRLLREQAEQEVRAPAIALSIASLLAVAPALFLLLLAFTESGPPGLVALALVQLTLAVVMLIGSWRMWQLSAYTLAVLAASLAVLPNMAWLITLPIGIWALAVLCRSHVRRAFGVVRNAQRDQSGGRGAGVAVAFVLIGAACVVMALPVLICVGLFVPVMVREARPASAVPYATAVETRMETGATKQTEFQPITWQDDKPQIHHDQARWLRLTPEQEAAVNEALAEVARDYQKAEQEHVTRKTNDLGHEVIVVDAFPKELTRLENAFWTKVDQAVTDDTIRGQLREQLPLRRDLFPFGEFQQTVEIWKVGAWYHYQFGNAAGPSRGPELPRTFRHLWQDEQGQNAEGRGQK